MRRHLSVAIAKQIVEDVGTLIQRDMLITSPTGKVLAATRSSMAGHTLDLRTQEFVEADADQANEFAEDESLSGMPIWGGTLLPVLSDGEVVCVIGLTGESDDTQECNRVLRVMTSILFSAERDMESDASIRKSMDRFLEDWLFSSLPVDTQSLEIRGRHFGLDISRPRTACVLLIQEVEDDDDETLAKGTPDMDQVLALLRDHDGESSRERLMIAIGSRVILLYDTDNTEVAKDLLENTRKVVEDNYPVHVFAGTGLPRKSFADLRESVREAERAARNARLSGQRDVLGFDEITLELFLQDVPPRTRREFRQRILQGIPEAERKTSFRLLSAYFENEGSLVRTAAQLGIHKNTLQYRLRRLEERTGLDPRKLRDALPLYLATLMQESL